MRDLNPITREEKILSGEDISPKTRTEYFLKRASENGGAKTLVAESDGNGNIELSIGV